MRILIISPYYFPYINPRAARWTALAEFWAKQGLEVHIICSKRAGYKKEEIQNGVAIHRTGYNSLKEVLYHLINTKKRRGEAEESLKSNKPSRSKFLTLFVWFNENIIKKLYFPDDAFIWYRKATKRAVKLQNERKFDVLISVSLPFTAQLIGLNFKKKYPNIPWLVDIGDPFAFQFTHPLNNHFFYKQLNINLEKRVLEMADAVSVTTKGAKELYENHFPAMGEKISIMPPLKSRVVAKSAKFSHDVAFQKIHIGYFGSFFKNVREPNAFLELLRSTFQQYPDWRDKIEIHFFGDIIEHFTKTFEKAEDLKESLKFYGLVPKETAEALMGEMDFLLNIGNQTTFQLPSKSVDYLASGKPIINICSIEADTFASFFKSYPFILNLKLEQSKIEKLQIERFLAFLIENKGKTVEQSLLKEIMQPFEIESISAQYLNCLSKTAQKYLPKGDVPPH